MLLSLLRISSKVLKWAIFSPSLNGYYQEIKTLWKPEIGFKGARESQNERFVILDGVLGNLLFKTPYLGEIPINKTSDSVYLTVSGYFDQSSMEMPILNDKIWFLDEALDTDILLELD